MGSFDLGKSTTPILKTVKKDVLYVNTNKAKACKNNIIKDINNINNDLTNIYKCLKKCCDQKVVKGDWEKQVRGWSKKAKSQAAASKTHSKSLSSKFDADIRDYAVKLLTDRLDALEEQVRRLTAK